MNRQDNEPPPLTDASRLAIEQCIQEGIKVIAGFLNSNELTYEERTGLASEELSWINYKRWQLGLEPVRYVNALLDSAFATDGTANRLEIAGYVFLKDEIAYSIFHAREQGLSSAPRSYPCFVMTINTSDQSQTYHYLSPEDLSKMQDAVREVLLK